MDAADPVQNFPRTSKNGKIRVFLADDHDVVREGLRALLEDFPRIEVAGEARTGREAVKKINELKPDVAILDISMPELNGLEVTRSICKNCPETAVLILTIHESEQLIQDVLGAGARGYMLKSDAARHLALAVEALFDGGPFFTSSVGRLVVQGYLKEAASSPHSLSSALTPSEREVLQLLAEGRSNKEVAAIKEISVKTAETHRANIMRKLKLRSACDIVHHAVRNGMIEV